MSDIRISHTRFRVRNLSVRPAAWFGPKLLLDGEILRREKGVYRATDDAGASVLIKLKAGLDPIPKLQIDGVDIEVARPLAWYEYVWAAWPFLLVGVGGAVGGALGGGVAVLNLRIIRKDWVPLARYAASGILAVVAVLTYLVIAAVIREVAFPD